ncbi:MAG: hypothetical protein U9N30_02510, partial [Campylobacterota bacterium]|nr:hypothetical protein [Campylobacterota bacterium]
IVIISLIGVYSVVFLGKIHTQSHNNSQQNAIKTQLYTAHNILKNRQQNGLNTTLVLKEDQLYLEEKIFLRNVSKFSNSTPMEICLGKELQMCQKINLQ